MNRALRPLLIGFTLIASPALAQGQANGPAPETAQPAASLIGPALHVSDLPRALRFYTEGLGMRVQVQMGPPERRETILGFGGAPGAAGIVLLNDATAAPPVQIVQSNGFARLILRVSGLPVLVARLRQLGFTASDVRETGHGYGMVMATDPDGYSLELVESRATAPARH